MPPARDTLATLEGGHSMQYAWAVILLVLAVIFIVAAFVRVDDIGNRQNPDKVQGIISAIISNATLNVLSEGQEVEEAVAQATQEEIEDVSDNAREDIETDIKKALEEATREIRENTTDAVQPALQTADLSESGAELAADVIVDAALENLMLEPEDLADTVEVQADTIVAAERALNEALLGEELRMLPESDRQRLEQSSQEIEETTANALTTAIDEGLSEGVKTATSELDDDTNEELGKEEVPLQEIPIPNTALPAIFLLISAAAFQQFLGAVTKLVS